MKLSTSLIFPIFLIFLSHQFTYGQEAKTEKIRFRVNNLPKGSQSSIAATKTSVIEIIDPFIQEGKIYMSQDASLDLSGRVAGEIKVNQLWINSKKVDMNESGYFTANIQLIQGENNIRMSTVDETNNVQEHYYTIQYTPAELTFEERITKESQYYGVLIGIDDYMDVTLPQLDNPIKDAEKLYNTLTELYSFKDENIMFLRNPTREEIIMNLDELALKVTPDDNVLIFYAGHGWWDEVAENGYWLPSDANSNEKTNWFRNSTMVEYLREINSKHTLLIADACFGGSIFKTRSVTPGKDMSFAKLYERPSRKAMTSGTLTEVPDQSSFIRYLIERLNENNNRFLSTASLFDSFQEAVIHNSDAVPQYEVIKDVGDQGGEFIFLRK